MKSNGLSQGERALTTIRERILDCVVAPGSFVSERGLSAELGLGIASVRSALARLASEGLVIPEPRVGYRVAPIAVRDVLDFFEAWLILGPEMFQLAITRMTEDQRRRLEGLELPDDASPEAIVRHVEAQWTILVEAVDNDVLADFNDRLQRDLHRVLIIAYRRSEEGRLPSLLLPRMLESAPMEAHAAAVEYISAFRERITQRIIEDAFASGASLTSRRARPN